jgi:hypothetical protein
MDTSDEPVSQESTTIISLDELLQTREAIVSSEANDRTKLLTLVNIDETELRNKLLVWATSGFLPNYILYEIQLGSRCSDGVNRNCMEYITYLGTTFEPVSSLNILQQRLPGMTLSYSYTHDFTFRVHVSKTS